MSRLDPNWRVLQNLADKRPWNGRQVTALEPGDTLFPNGNHTLGVVRDGQPYAYADLWGVLRCTNHCEWMAREQLDAALAWAVEAHPIGRKRCLVSGVKGEADVPREVYAVAIENGSVWVWLAGIGRVLAQQVEVPR